MTWAWIACMLIGVVWGDISTKEKNALIDLRKIYHPIDHPWTAENPCAWYGIVCQNVDGEEHVTKLTMLRPHAIHGALPDSIGDLTYLIDLKIGQSPHTLHGTIPDTIGNLVSLRRLQLDDTALEAPVPWESLFKLRSLEWLNMDSNPKFACRIPQDEWKDAFPNMTILNLAGNNHTDTVPISMTKMGSLEILWLQDNHLTGAIPPFGSNTPKLQTLRLTNNPLSGSIPDTFGQLSTHLWGLFLGVVPPDGGYLQGGIPASFSQLTTLEELEIGSLDLSAPGSLDALKGHTTHLNHLYLLRCKMASLPSWFADLPITALHVDGNRFTSLPVDILSKMSLLHTLTISQNRLTPEGIGMLDTLDNLITLDLSENHLKMNIEDVFLPDRLMDLYMSDNPMVGTIPDSFCTRWLDCDLQGTQVRCNQHQFDGKTCTTTCLLDCDRPVGVSETTFVTTVLILVLLLVIAAVLGGVYFLRFQRMRAGYETLHSSNANNLENNSLLEDL